MNTPISPIHWERYGDKPAKVVDLRTLPEDVKVEIIQAALNVAFRHDNGELYEVRVGSPNEKALDHLADKVAAISLHMHEVNLVPCP